MGHRVKRKIGKPGEHSTVWGGKKNELIDQSAEYGKT